MDDMFGRVNCEPAIKKISKIPFGGYTGNKRKILGPIWRIIEEEDIEFNSIFDAFSGSAVFSLFMKFMQKRVITNDLLTSSYLNAYSLVENPGYCLNYDEMLFVINNETDFDYKDGFVYKNYKDVRFTEKECIALDKFRYNMAHLDNSYKAGVGFVNTKTVESKLPFGGIDRGTDMAKHRQRQMKNYGKSSTTHDRRIGLYYDDDMNLDFEVWFPKYNQKLNQNLLSHNNSRIKMGKAFMMRNMESNILKNCFLGGRYNNGQVIADLKHRQGHDKHKSKNTTDIDFVSELIMDYTSGKYDSILTTSNYQPCLSLNCDVIELVENNDFVTDVVYLDPPYGGASTDYAYLYQFLEEYIYGQKIEDLEHVQKFGKRFVGKKTYEENFTRLLEGLERFPVWIVSYNDSSWESKDYIANLLKKYKKIVNVHPIENYTYNYRDKKKKGSSGTEYVFVAKDK